MLYDVLVSITLPPRQDVDLRDELRHLRAAASGALPHPPTITGPNQLLHGYRHVTGRAAFNTSRQDDELVADLRAEVAEMLDGLDPARTFSVVAERV